MMPIAMLPAMLSAAIATAPPARSSIGPTLYDNFAVPTFQVVAAEGIIVGSLLLIDGLNVDAAWPLVFLAPIAVPLSTCLIGNTSIRYRGSCAHSSAGALLGFVSGLIVLAVFEAAPSLNPLHRGQDDTQSFVNGVAAAAYVALIGIPIGSVVAWNVGKTSLDAPVPPEPPPAVQPRGDPFFGRVAPRFVLPLVSLRF